MAKKIPVNRARVGDVLAEPVLEDHGRVLLGAGTPLAENHLELMRQRGVEILTVQDGEEDGPAPPPPPLDPETLKEIVLEQGRWFGEARKDPVMAEIFRCVINRKARQPAGKR